MKKIILFIFLLLLCSCSSKINYSYSIKTIIEENPNTLIAINYPKTNIKKINKNIQNYIDETYNNFLKSYNEISFLEKKHELNIDYLHYNFSNKYISIVLFKHISSSNNELVINEVFSYVYDIEENKEINFKTLIDTNDVANFKDLIYNLLFENYGNYIDLNKVTTIDYNNIKFAIKNDELILFFEGSKLCNNYNEILEIHIPITYLKKLNQLNKVSKQDVEYIEPTINYIDISKPVVALTFDDGPSRYTDEILDTLKKYDSNATFFVLGNKIEDYNNTIIKMYKNGNEIGNHSYNHRWLTRLSSEEQREQIEKTQEIIKNYTNYTPIYLRPTYGSVNKKLKNNTNLKIMLWNIDTKDWKYKDIDTIVNNALKDVEDGSIILMHDTYKRTSEAVKEIVPELIKQGYQLVTISELEEVKKIRKQLNES